MRIISTEAATVDIIQNGLEPDLMANVLDGGLTGQASHSSIIVGDDKVWEFEVGKDTRTRVYIYRIAEICDHPYIKSIKGAG